MRLTKGDYKTDVHSFSVAVYFLLTTDHAARTFKTAILWCHSGEAVGLNCVLIYFLKPFVGKEKNPLNTELAD